MNVFFLSKSLYIALSICVYWFKLVFQVSDVAHGPLVKLRVWDASNWLLLWGSPNLRMGSWIPGLPFEAWLMSVHSSTPPSQATVRSPLMDRAFWPQFATMGPRSINATLFGRWRSVENEKVNKSFCNVVSAWRTKRWNVETSTFSQCWNYVETATYCQPSILSHLYVKVQYIFQHLMFSDISTSKKRWSCNILST